MIVLTRCATMTTAASRVACLERGAQARVGRGVERREAVVEQVERGLLHQRPGDRQPLALAAGDVGAALVDRGVETPGHRGDEVARLGDLEGAPQLGVARLRLPEPQVARDRAAEQERRLRNEPDRAPQLFERLVAHVDAVDEHGAAGRVEEPRDEVEQRGLAAAGAADDRARLARLRARSERSSSTGRSLPG